MGNRDGAVGAAPVPTHLHRGCAARLAVDRDLAWQRPYPNDGQHQEWLTGILAHPYLTGVNRLAAASWLLEAGDTSQAASLLTWHENRMWHGDVTLADAALSGPAYLHLAHIEEARGHLDLARHYYRQFLGAMISRLRQFGTWSMRRSGHWRNSGADASVSGNMRSHRFLPWLLLSLRVAVPLAVIVLPFVILVRGAVLLYEDAGWSSWLALLTSAVAMIGVLALYGALMTRRLSGRARFGWIARWVALPLVVAFVVRGLLVLDSSHAQSESIRAEYRDTHPLLRVALATIDMADDKLVVTDMTRTAADYARMGLPLVANTMHGVQQDGWVHAVDIHTRGRGFLVNFVVATYFRAMGFRVLRHVGTADHLHVELPLR